MPVLILSARGGVRDKVSGLEDGADDYLSKPFRFEELLARIRVRLRDEGTAEQTVLRHGDLAHRADRARVHDARGLPAHAGQVLSREQLLSHAWGYTIACRRAAKSPKRGPGLTARRRPVYLFCNS